MCLLDDFFVNLTTVTVHYALLAQAIPPKNLDCHFSGVACGISLHWYAELIPRPHRAQKDACTTLVSSEKPAHLRQKMREIEPNL